MTRTLLLTGATRGLGRALADRLVADGHRVLGCGRSQGACAELTDRLGSDGRARFDAVDVADARAVDAWAQRLLEARHVPDLVLNNAALMNDPAPLWRVPAEEFDRLLAVNVSGTANVVRAFVPAMIERGSGVVCNVSSGWGRSTSPEVGPYCTTKHAIEGLTSSLAQELPRGLAAVSLNPGVVDTEMLRQCWGDAAAAQEGPEAWAERAAPFLLSIGPEHNGAQLTVP